MFDYSKSVPLETYKRVLLRLDPETLKSVCSTDIYAKNLCNDNYFNYQYINFNYIPYEYGYEEWIYNKHINWKTIFQKLSSPKKSISLSIIDSVTKNIKSFYVSIHKNDTFSNIINRIIRIYKSFNNKFIKGIILIGDKILLDYYEGKILLSHKVDHKPHDLLNLSNNLNTNIRSIGTLFDNINRITLSFDPMKLFDDKIIPIDNYNII